MGGGKERLDLGQIPWLFVIFPWLSCCCFMTVEGSTSGSERHFFSLERGVEEKPLLVDGTGCRFTLVIYPFLTCVGNSKVAVMWLELVTERRKLPVDNRRSHLEAHGKQPRGLSWMLRVWKGPGLPNFCRWDGSRESTVVMHHCIFTFVAMDIIQCLVY